MKLISIIIILFVTTTNCSNNFENRSDVGNGKKKMPDELSDTGGVTAEKFDDFYHRFERDSLFQLSRIQFPLPGFNTEKSNQNPDFDSTFVILGEKVNFYWQRDSWVQIKPLLDSSRFKITRKTTDTVVSESIFIPDSDFQIKMKFKLINHLWSLIYYLE